MYVCKRVRVNVNEAPHNSDPINFFLFSFYSKLNCLIFKYMHVHTYVDKCRDINTQVCKHLHIIFHTLIALATTYTTSFAGLKAQFVVTKVAE